MDHKILDGRNREKACASVGVEPRYTTVETDDPIAYVLSKNLHRRHLSTSQRTMIAAKAVEYEKARANERMQEGGKTAGRGRPQQGMDTRPYPIQGQGTARDKAGAALNVSGRNVDRGQRARRITAPTVP